MGTESVERAGCVVLAAAGSGGGKTTVTAGIVAALTKRGLAVQPFKVGPDYIDPSYHALAAGRPCRNLDSWMLGRDKVRESFARNTRTADIAIVEGVMGLFDGASGAGLEGSTADIAQLLDAPIVLVVNGRGMARSAAALVHGYATFEPEVQLAGVILNNVGSARHAALCAEAIQERSPEVAVLGYLLRDERLALPERHLGLIPTAEKGAWREVIDFAAEQIEKTVDLDRLVGLAERGRGEEKVESRKGGRSYGWVARSGDRPQGEGEGRGGYDWVARSGDRPQVGGEKRVESREGAGSYDWVARSGDRPQVGGEERVESRGGERVRIALADDAAFSFTYAENVELLEEAGAEIVRFSPLAGDDLPQGVQGVILVGGFPELYAEALSRNTQLMASLRRAHEGGVPIYGECGGLMVLTEGIKDLDGRFWPMVGILEGHCQMEKRVTLGYRIVQAAVAGPILPQGAEVRGHEFHYSSWVSRSDEETAAYTILPRRASEVTRPSGVVRGSVWASYIHLHFLTRPDMASRFVAWCATHSLP